MIINKNLKNIPAIYKITNLANGKFYIGSTANLYTRLYLHFSQLNKNKHSNPHLQFSYNKYGKENFKYEIVLFCKDEELLEAEQWFIDNMKPSYNIRNKCVSTQKGIIWSKKSKEKLSKSKTKGPIYEYDLNGNFVKEWESVKEICTVLKYTASVVRYVLQGKINKCKNSIFTYTKESGVKAYEFKRPDQCHHKLIYKKDKQGNILKIYYGLKECAKDLGLKRGTISAAVFYGNWGNKDYVLEYGEKY